ncbi:flavonol sulfotransferase-like [Capsicum annuum]
MSSSNVPSKAASRLSTNYGSEDFKEMHKKYREMITTLPRREPHHDVHDVYQYQGFWYPIPFLESALCMQENFNAQPSDIFLCSVPKTGTTLLKALTFSIMTRHMFHHNDPNNPLFNKVPHECLLFLEFDFLHNPELVDTSLPLLATHLPYNVLPKSILQSNNCKIIYIYIENPKIRWFLCGISHKGLKKKIVVLVPLHLIRNSSGFAKEKVDMDLIGIMCWSIGKQVLRLEYWKASIERPDRVFFFKYEDLKEDTLGYMKKLADFTEKPFSKEEEAQGVPGEIVVRCNFKSLRNLEVNKSSRHRPETTQGISNSIFF